MPQKEAIIDFFQRFEVSQQRYNVNIVQRILMESWYIVIVVDEMQLEQKLQHYFFEVRLVHTLIFGLMLQILIVRQLLYLHYLVEHVLKFLPCFVHLFVYINRDVLIWLRYFLKVYSFTLSGRSVSAITLLGIMNLSLCWIILPVGILLSLPYINMTVLQSIARPLQKICRNELLNIPHIYMHIYHLLSTPKHISMLSTTHTHCQFGCFS